MFRGICDGALLQGKLKATAILQSYKTNPVQVTTFRLSFPLVLLFGPLQVAIIGAHQSSWRTVRAWSPRLSSQTSTPWSAACCCALM